MGGNDWGSLAENFEGEKGQIPAHLSALRLSELGLAKYFKKN
jgi:hypothetical protein